jgi:hypothetical protein
LRADYVKEKSYSNPDPKKERGKMRGRYWANENKKGDGNRK